MSRLEEILETIFFLLSEIQPGFQIVGPFEFLYGEK
jgi:hypothetical protein